MEYGALMQNPAFGTFSDSAAETAFMDELFVDGCWIETTGGHNFMQATATRAFTDPSSHYLACASDQPNHVSIDPNQQQMYQEESENAENMNPGAIFQSEGFVVESTEVGKRWWIGPRANPGPSSSVKERLVLAIGYLMQYIKNPNLLIQIWLPARRGGRYVDDQPYLLDPNCTKESLEYYRGAFRQLASEEDSIGLAGQIYLRRLPEWTPNVRFFRSLEYTRANYAQYDIGGPLAVPVFERK